jgi:hypothetical protein
MTAFFQREPPYLTQSRHGECPKADIRLVEPWCDWLREAAHDKLIRPWNL